MSPLAQPTSVELGPPPARLDPRRHALFVDIDGTLIDFAPRPDLVHVPIDVPPVLRQLRERYGAVSVLSGRRLEDLDNLLDLRGYAVGALHGLELRRVDGRLQRYGRAHALAPIRAALPHRCADVPGVLVEDKGAGIALHYREHPDLGPHVFQLAAALIQAHPDLTLIAGDHVVEIKLRASDKGGALRRIMEDPGFTGRAPIMLGDDHTDEDAFAATYALDGFGVVVGDRRPTTARYALHDPAAARRWLRGLCAPA
jgi:trehalose 6-phosphate phosphatase